MRKTRFWVFAASAVVLLLLGSALFLALEGFGAPVAHAQEEATPTSTGGGGIRTVLTATVEPMATGEAPTEAPAATPSLPASETTTTAAPGTASSPISGSLPAGTERSITVVGEGTVNIQPDVAHTTIGVEVVSDTVKAATNAVNDIMGGVLDALHGQGIDDKDIQTSGYNIYVERTSSPTATGGTADVVRYHVSNSVAVTIRDVDKVGNVLDATIAAGANSIYGVTFDVDDPSQPESQAYSKAMDDARARAEYLASLAGLQVGPVISISEIVGNSGVVAMRSAATGMGGGGGQISPGELEVTRQLQVVYSIQ